MIIENSQNPPTIRRGRPTIYPFIDISPGQKLTIPGNENIRSHYMSVFNSLNYFKKNNALAWETTVRIEGNNIVVYRLN